MSDHRPTRPTRHRRERRERRETLLINRGVLLNFWLAPFWLPHPITDELYCYPGVEWRFNAYKALFVKGMNKKMQQRIHDRIASQKTAGAAKQLGRGLSPFSSDLWDDHSYNVMLLANLAKFTQNPRCAAILKDTENKILVEHRRDPIWGDNIDGSGKNLQGKILEAVRDVI